MSLFDRLSLKIWTLISSATVGISAAYADGLGPPPPIQGLPSSSPTSSDQIVTILVNIVVWVLNFLAILAVIFIIIGGIRLIVSQGEEQAKEKAKKTILYVVIGLIVVLLARVIVGFFTGGAFTQALGSV